MGSLRRAVRRSLALGLVLASSSAAHARAPAEPCSVVRKCSSTGVACLSDDRACLDDARSRGLEVVCDNVRTAEQKEFVYCPPLTDQRDSKVVWLLLGVAVLLAVTGSGIAFLVFRKKASPPA